MKANAYAEGRAPAVPQANHLGTPAANKTKTPARKGSAGWLVPAGLILLVVIPLASGALRLIELAGGPKIMPANPPMTAMPLPVVVHIACASLFALLGAFQFAAGFRRRHRDWHRLAGRLVVACGLLVGLSGLWMTLFYTSAESTGDLLYDLRLLFGSAMVVAIALGFAAIRRGDVLGHRAWMTRAYAIGLGAGTQVLTGMAASLIVSHPTALSTGLAMGAGWMINLALAEWSIRKHPAHSARAASAVVSHSR